MTITEWLDEAEARSAVASGGSWYATGPFNEEECGQPGGQAAAVLTDPDEDGVQHAIAENCEEPDAEFIAHARTDLPRALKIVRAAIEVNNTYGPYEQFNGLLDEGGGAMTISRHPQRINKDAWYYEEPYRLDLFIHVTPGRIELVQLPARKLLKSLTRMGLISAPSARREKGKVGP